MRKMFMHKVYIFCYTLFSNSLYLPDKFFYYILNLDCRQFYTVVIVANVIVDTGGKSVACIGNTRGSQRDVVYLG
jgi:hypothetical protein